MFRQNLLQQEQSQSLESYTKNTGATSGNCESVKVVVTRSVRELLSQPGVISGTSPLCDGSSGVAYSVAVAAASTPVGGGTQYGWTSSGGGGVTINSSTTQNPTVDYSIGRA